MTVEASDTSSTVHIDDLDADYPADTDLKKEGDDHLRLIKQVLLNTFPNIDGPIEASDEELGYLVGLGESFTATQARLNVGNLLINGDFVATAADIFYAPSSGTYISAQWRINYTGTGGVLNVYNLAAEGWSSAYGGSRGLLNVNLMATPSSGGSEISIMQPLEGAGTLAGTRVGVSLYVRSATNSGSPDRNIEVKLIQDFGSGGSYAITVTSDEGAQAVTYSTSSVTRLTWHFNLPSVSGKTFSSTTDASSLRVKIILGNESQVLDWYLSGIKFEPLAAGAVPSCFVPRSIGLEMAAWARFYQTVEVEYSPLVVTSSSAARARRSLPIRMRYSPTLSLTSGALWYFRPGTGNVSGGSLSTSARTQDYVDINLSSASGLTAGQSIYVYGQDIVLSSEYLT